MSKSIHPICTLAVIAGLLSALQGANAATRLWPASPECPGTLQACADAAIDGDRIEIRSGAPIDENIILINRSLTLTAADAVLPVFAAGRFIDIGSGTIGSNITFNVSRLKLVNGFVRLRYDGTGTATFDVRGLDLERTPGGSPAFINVAAGQARDGQRERAREPHRRRSGRPQRRFDRTWRGRRHLERVRSLQRAFAHRPGTGDGAGIFVDVYAQISEPGSGYVRLFATISAAGSIAARSSFPRGSFRPRRARTRRWHSTT